MMQRHKLVHSTENKTTADDGDAVWGVMYGGGREDIDSGGEAKMKGRRRRVDVAAHPHTASAQSVGGAAVTPAESENRQSAVVRWKRVMNDM